MELCQTRRLASAPDPPAEAIVTRNPEEIVRVLEMLAAGGAPLRTVLGAGGLTFTSRLRFVDPAREHILIEPSTDAEANRALLARPRASFLAMHEELHVEFAAAAPQRDARTDAIRLRFPEVLARAQRRSSERLAPHPEAPLRFVADAGGVISFDGWLADIGTGGIGFVHYALGITLEPGTVLRGCRIEIPGRGPIMTDLEVRYSRPVTLPDGRQALRSGCRFVNLPDEARALIASLLGR